MVAENKLHEEKLESNGRKEFNLCTFLEVIFFGQENIISKILRCSHLHYIEVQKDVSGKMSAAIRYKFLCILQKSIE